MKLPWTLSPLLLVTSLAFGCASSHPVQDGAGGDDSTTSGSSNDQGAQVAGSGGTTSSGVIPAAEAAVGVGSGPGPSATSGAGGAPTTGSGPSQTSAEAVGSGPSATSVTSGAGPSTGSGGGDTCTGGAPPADPKCYWEPVCPTASLDDLEQGYSSGNWLATSLAMMGRRYPSAKCLIDLYANDVGNYADPSSFAALAESLMTMAHEETHGFDYDHASWGNTFAYYQGCSTSLTAPWVEGFPRSEIAAEVEGTGTSLYDGTYLVGTQGTYGWLEVLDEWNAYLDGMAAIGLAGDKVKSTISGTDGALALAYYAELYLRVARTQHPAVYADIKGKFPEILRQQWNRMHFFLALAEQYPNLSIEAATIKTQLYDQKNQSELEMVIGVQLTPTACN